MVYDRSEPDMTVTSLRVSVVSPYRRHHAETRKFWRSPKYALIARHKLVRRVGMLLTATLFDGIRGCQRRHTTGAGDAYLGGFVFGLAREMPLPVAGRMAALAASYAIEQRGCQEHSYTPDEFVARYERVFGQAPELARLSIVAMER